VKYIFYNAAIEGERRKEKVKSRQKTKVTSNSSRKVKGD